MVRAANASTLVLHRLGMNRPVRRAGNLRVVVFHGIGERSSPCMRHLDDETPAATFAAQLSYLQTAYRMVSLEAGVAAVANGKASGPLCSVTFDDGLESVHSVAFPILAARAIPLEVFLNTAVLGNRRLLWHHLLSYVIETHGLAPTHRRLAGYAGWSLSETPATGFELITMCRHRFPSFERSQALERLVRDLRIDPESVAARERLYLDWDQVRTMAGRGVGFHSHTANHLPLGAVSLQTMQREIDVARRDLAGQLGPASGFISFPFGMRATFGVRASEYALANGYQVRRRGRGRLEPPGAGAPGAMREAGLSRHGRQPPGRLVLGDGGAAPPEGPVERGDWTEPPDAERKAGEPRVLRADGNGVEVRRRAMEKVDRQRGRG